MPSSAYPDIYCDGLHAVMSAAQEFTLQRGVLQFSPRVLHGKRTAPYYLDWRPVLNDIEFCFSLAEFVLTAALFSKWNFKHFVGVPNSTDFLANIAATLYHARGFSGIDERVERSSFLRVRTLSSEDRARGKKELIGKAFGPAVVIEDVITTGESIEESVLIPLLRNKVAIAGLIVLTDRNERNRGQKPALKALKKKYGLEVLALTEVAELLPKIFSGFDISPEQKRLVFRYFEDHGTKKLHLPK